MIHLIENNVIAQSWPSLPQAVVLPDGTRIHAQHLQRSYGWEYLETIGLFREQTLPVTLGENQYVSGHTVQVINGRPVEVPVVATYTTAELGQQLLDRVPQLAQKYLDDFARTRNYDGILSACTYATSVVPRFQAEGQYCVQMRDAVWGTLYTMLGEVQAGTRPMPTIAEAMAALPVLEWPV